LIDGVGYNKEIPRLFCVNPSLGGSTGIRFNKNDEKKIQIVGDANDVVADVDVR